MRAAIFRWYGLEVAAPDPLHSVEHPLLGTLQEACSLIYCHDRTVVGEDVDEAHLLRLYAPEPIGGEGVERELQALCVALPRASALPIHEVERAVLVYEAGVYAAPDLGTVQRKCERYLDHPGRPARGWLSTLEERVPGGAAAVVRIS